MKPLTDRRNTERVSPSAIVIDGGLALGRFLLARLRAVVAALCSGHPSLRDEWEFALFCRSLQRPAVEPDAGLIDDDIDHLFAAFDDGRYFHA